MIKLITQIFDALKLGITGYQKLAGGDISEAYRLYGNDRHYFIKINAASRYPDMFEQEADGLNELRSKKTLVVPEVIKAGVESTQQYLLLEWIEAGNRHPDFWKIFGEGLAVQHKQSQLHFGLDNDNYIGSLKQVNTPKKTWSEFYSVCRILPFVKQLFDADLISKEDMTNADSLCKHLNDLFPQEPSALLHGDLWNGNFLVTTNGLPALIDPAVYYGHREMDLGMTKLFGGFEPAFYDAYGNAYPLEKNWQQRLPLTQLYPLLVHAILFGGHYITQVTAILNKFA